MKVGKSMFNIFSRTKFKFSSVPSWARFFRLKKFNEFIEMIEKEFTDFEVIFKADEGFIQFPEVFGDNQLGLQNLASVCHNNNEHDWPEIIKSHFENLQEGYVFEKEFKENALDFDYASKYVAVRVWPRSYIESVPKDKTIFKEDIDDTVTVLVYDLPTTVRSISPSEVIPWNMSSDELFEIGLKNVLNNYSVEISTEKMNNEEYYVLHGEHLFVASFSLVLENFAQCLGKFGAIIGLPHRHVMIVYPINGSEVISSLNSLISVVHGMNAEGPGSIISNVYWYNQNKYLKLPYSLEKKKINFYPPEEFVQLLNEICQ